MLWRRSGQCVGVCLSVTTMLWSVCTVLCMLTAVSAATQREEGLPVVVKTRYGALRGARKRIDPDSHVDIFYNIPYAKPPTGYLRFHKPVVNEPWTGIRDATTPGPRCPQAPFGNYTFEAYSGQEDCLYLNVYTPKVAADCHQVAADCHKLPVMVWIHGGGLFIGAGNQYDATQLAAKGVVVVTINYRLGALGFLSTQDGASIGNYGLWDQIQALQWVRDVISAFNGDPNDVTIFGESAGSNSVSLLALSREGRGLFTKAIMESGASLLPSAVGYPTTEPTPREATLKLASRLGCGVGDSNQIVACLKTKDARSIVNKTAEIELENDALPLFRPVPETTFGQYGLFSAAPEVILKNGWFHNVTVIRGFNKDELSGVLGVTDPDDDGYTMEEFMTFTRQLVENSVMRQYKVDANRTVDLVADTYVRKPGLTDPKELRAAYIQLMTDYYFVAPTYKEQQLYFDAHGKTEYMYRFSFRSPNRLNKLWQGVTHGDELAYVFGSPFATNGDSFVDFPPIVSSWTDEDRRVSERMMAMWTNFAKYGNPTPDGSDGLKWLPWTQTTPSYLDLGVQSTMVNAPDTPGIRLWNDVIPGLATVAVG